MALQQRASPGSPRRRACVATLGLAVLALAFALIAAVPMQAADPEAAPTQETPSEPGGASPPDQATPDQAAPNQTAPDQAGQAQPYTGSQPPPGVEVITVRRRALQEMQTEVPASVVQFDPKEIEALGAQDVSDLARVTPNLEIKSLSATTPTFFIRGVGLNDFSANAAGAVAIYHDGVPIDAPALQTTPLFDIAGVDLLRGPQGYDDNRNASGGAIHTRSREPTGHYEASLRADYGRFNSQDYEGALEVPVVPDWLSARGAFRLSSRDPFYMNRCGGKMDSAQQKLVVCNETNNGTTDYASVVPQGLPGRVNDQGRWAARALIRLQPPHSETDMDWLLNVHGGQLDQDTPLGQPLGVASGAKVYVDGQPVSGAPGKKDGYVDPDVARIYKQYQDMFPPPFGRNRRFRNAGARNTYARELTLAAIARDISLADPFSGDFNKVGKEKLKSIGGSLRGELSLGPVRTTTITGMERYQRQRGQDFDNSSDNVIGVDSKDKSWQATENLGFEWELPPEWLHGTLRWGGYYLREHLKSDSLFGLELLPSNVTLTHQNYTQDYDSLGVFGNFSWDFLDDFTLDGGVRFNWEHKKFEMVAANRNFSTGKDNESAPAGVEKTWSAPTGGIGLTYYFTPDVTAYAKYTRGWKGGHIQGNSLRSQTTPNAAGLVTARPTVAGPETIHAFEIGARGRWLDDRLELSAALFHYHYENYQVFVTESQYGSAPVLKIINANDARLYGAEAEFRVEPLRGWVPRVLEGLTLSGRLGWIESKFLDFTDARNILFSGANGTPIVVPTTVDFTGNRLPNTPRFKFSGTFDYSFDLGRWGTWGLRYDLNWTDDIFFDPSNGRGVASNPFFGLAKIPDYAVGQPAYMLHDLRLSYRLPSGKVEIAGWCHNLTNEIYKTFVADVTPAFNSLENFVGDPRTFGASFSVFF